MSQLLSFLNFTFHEQITNTLAAAVHLQRYHQSSTTESVRQRNNNNSGLILLVFLLQKSSV